jgi:hypothetical protein
MARHGGGNPLDWMTLALMHARHGELGRSREAFDRAARADKGTGPGVGYSDVRGAVAALLGMAPEVASRPRGPRASRDEGSPILNPSLPPGGVKPEPPPVSRNTHK